MRYWPAVVPTCMIDSTATDATLQPNETAIKKKYEALGPCYGSWLRNQPAPGAGLLAPFVPAAGSHPGMRLRHASCLSTRRRAAQSRCGPARF